MGRSIRFNKLTRIIDRFRSETFEFESGTDRNFINFFNTINIIVHIYVFMIYWSLISSFSNFSKKKILCYYQQLIAAAIEGLKRKCIFKKNFNIVYIRIKINHFQYAISNHIANKRENKKKTTLQLSKRNLFFPSRHRKHHILKQISHREPRFIFPRAKWTAYARVLWTFSVWFSIEKKDLCYREREREREGTVVSKQPVRKACGRSVTRWLTARIPSSSLYDDGSMDRCNCRQRVPEMCSPCMTRITDKGHASTTAFVREFTNR